MSDTITVFPHPILRKKAEAVHSFDEYLRQLIARMDRVMRLQPSGIGIAAPQIGVSLQVAIVDVLSRTPKARKYVLINPQIIDYQEEIINREGCMSIPDYTAHVKRYGRIKFLYQDEFGKRHEGSASGIEAICIQHEVDHLSGKLFIDHVVSLMRDMIPRPKFTAKR